MKFRRNDWWFIFGLLFYLGIATYSLSSVSLSGFFEMVDASVDWLAAATPYFFIGALFGQIIDWFTTKKIKKDILVTTLLFWMMSIIIFIYFNPTRISFSPFFVIAYSVFFTSFAWDTLFHYFILHVAAGKLILNTLYLLVFGVWLYLTYASTKQLLRRILLFVLIVVLFVGMTSCAAQI